MRFKSALFGAVTALTLAGPAVAAPVQVGIGGASFTPGSGYGVDVSELLFPTLLDVKFSTATFAAQNFTLAAAGASRTFSMGTITLDEPDFLFVFGGIEANETDNLGVTARLNFLNPFGDVVRISATGIATLGVVGDAGVDFSIDWSPVDVAFGHGGSLRVSLADMSFRAAGAQNQSVTVTYLSEPVVNAVPEPASLALMGLGLVGLASTRRRRA